MTKDDLIAMGMGEDVAKTRLGGDGLYSLQRGYATNGESINVG